MNIFGTLILVSAAIILTFESVRGHGDYHGDSDVDGHHYWRGPYKPYRPQGPDYFSPYKHHGPHYYEPHRRQGPHNFHPPHHHYYPSHHGPCVWFGGRPGNHWGWGPNKHPRPTHMAPPMTPPQMAPPTMTPSEMTIPSMTPPPMTPPHMAQPTMTPSPKTLPNMTPPPPTKLTTNSIPNTEQPTAECALDCLINPGDVNPVCGSNGVTYRNDMTLECVRACGIDVWLAYREKCESGEDSGINEIPPSVLPTLDSVGPCMITCPSTSEYNPVCGSDGLTYSNPGRLECAKICGRDVDVMKAARCPTDFVAWNPNTGTIPLTAAPANTNATPKTTSPNIPPVTSSDLPDTDSRAANALPNDFTVPQDLLDEIFTTEYSQLINVRRQR